MTQPHQPGTRCNGRSSPTPLHLREPTLGFRHEARAQGPALHPRWLGYPQGARGQRHRPRRHAPPRRAHPRHALHGAADVRAGRGPARGADGQLRGGPHQHRRRPHRLPGPGAHQPAPASPGSSPPTPSSAPRSTRPRRRARPFHLLGLVSPGGVHSSMDHLYCLLEAAHERGVPHVYVHAFTDGRDTPPQSGLGYVEELEQFLRETRTGPHRHRGRALLRAWTATSGGTGCSSPTRRIVHGRGPQGPRCALRHPRLLRGEGDGRVHQAHRHRPRRRHPGGPHPRWRRGDVLQLPRGPRPRADARPRLRRLQGVRPGRPARWACTCA